MKTKRNTFEIVNLIRIDYYIYHLKQVYLQEKYNLSESIIHDIVKNISWKIKDINIYKDSNYLLLNEFETIKGDIYKKGKMVKQICTNCNLLLNIEQFNNNSWCKNCIKNYKKQYSKLNAGKIALNKQIYYRKNKTIIKQRAIDHYKNNKEYKLLLAKEYVFKNLETIKERKKIYYQKNKIIIKQKVKKYNSNKYKTNIQYRLKNRISSSIRKYLKSHNLIKKGSVLKFLSYTIEELKKHLENQFEPWMTWNNYGQYNCNSWNDNDCSTWTWQIDHIVPHSSFEYTSMEDNEFQECWALNNLRPLSSKENLLKGNKFIL